MGNEDCCGLGSQGRLPGGAAWCTMVDNPGGKNSKGQHLLVEELGRFEGQKRDHYGWSSKRNRIHTLGAHVDGGDEG